MRPLAIAVVAAAVVGCSPQMTPLGSHDAGLDAGVDAGVGKPVVLFLIDKSGSMSFAMDPNDVNCPANCGSGAPCPASCPTRMQGLKAAANAVLTSNGSRAWAGMAIFPTAVPGGNNVIDACGATSSADIKVQLNPQASDLAQDMQANADLVNTEVQKMVAGGGTPTGDSLAFLRGYAPLNNSNRPNYLVLITDGLPNCNANNPNNCNTSACECTLVPSNACTPASFCSQGCLDRDHSVDEIAKLRAKGIRVIVIGIGAETGSSMGAVSLNAMAAAGGMARTCTMDADCGTGDTCETTAGTCARKYYQVESSIALSAALTQVMQRL